MKKNLLDITLFKILLNDQDYSQLTIVENHPSEEAGFTQENLIKLRGATSYQSTAYCNALKQIH